MAKSKSLLRLEGKIGGMVFFHRKGQNLVREEGTISKSRIQNDPNFRRVRENGQEFGGAAHATKSLFRAIKSILLRMGSKGSFPSLLALFRQVIKLGNGNRGELSLEVQANRNLFLGYGFAGTEDFGSVYAETYSLTANAGRNVITLTVPTFNPIETLRYPIGATHFRVVCGASVVSDFEWDAVLKRYVPTQPALSGIHEVAWSPETAIGAGAVSLAPIVATLPGAPTLTSDCGVITVIGIEFLQEVAGNSYVLAEGNALVIAEVF